jgi:hypothetical protein
VTPPEKYLLHCEVLVHRIRCKLVSFLHSSSVPIIIVWNELVTVVTKNVIRLGIEVILLNAVADRIFDAGIEFLSCTMLSRY